MKNWVGRIITFLCLFLFANATFYGISTADTGNEVDPDNFESFWRDGIKVMVKKLPVYEKTNIDSKIIYEIPYGTKCRYKLSKEDYAWMMIDANGHKGYALVDGCSFNGINEEKGQEWFESELSNMMATLRSDSHTYDDYFCMDGYEQEDPVVYEKYDDNPGDVYYEPGEISRIFLFLGGSILAFIILWIVSGFTYPALKYFIKTFGCGACLVFFIVNLARYVEIRNLDYVKPYYWAVLVLWAAWWKFYFYRMALDLDISNENIKVSLFCTIIAACKWIISPLSTHGPNILGLIVCAILLWIIDSPTRHRCPNCHRMKAVYFNRREKAGTLTEETNDLSTSQVDRRNLGNEVEIDYETKRIYVTKVYQMWRHYYKCRFCGSEYSKKKKGSLIARDSRSVVEERVTKRIG